MKSSRIVAVLLAILVISALLAGWRGGNTQALIPFTDDAGQIINIPKVPQRIVSIGPTITEVLVALGASEKIVGIDDFSYWPSTMGPIHRLGEPFIRGDVINPKLGIDTNAVVALHPDLVIANFGHAVRDSEGELQWDPEALRLGLKKAGIPVVYLNPVVGVVAGTPKLLLSLGVIIGESDKANALVASYERRKQAVVERVQDLPKVRVVLAWGHGGGPPAPGLPVAEDDPLSELIQLAGGVDVFTSSPEDKQMLTKFSEDPFTLEPYIAKNPEVLLVLGGGLYLWQLDRPGWERVDAVQKGRVHEIGEITPLMVLDRLEEIAKLLHPGIDWEVSDIPSIIIYTRTKYVNSHLSLKYPIQTNRKLTVLTGVVESVPVSKMDPVSAVSINGQVLSDPETKGFNNKGLAIGKKITVKGYLGEINDTFLSFHGEKMRKFYVVDVIGWQFICGNSITETGTISPNQQCLWFEEGTIKGYTSDPEYPYQTDKELVTLTGTVETGEGLPEKDEYSRYLTVGERKSISVDGKHLFNIKTGKQFSEFDLFSPSLIGKDILIKGYPEQTATVDYYAQVYPGGKISVRFDNVFYVSEIIGWQRLHFIDSYDNKSIYYWSEPLNN